MKHSFATTGLSESMLTLVEQLHFKQPTDIQTQAIPEIINRRNIVGESQTGSGKTHAYLLPLLDKMNRDEQEAQIVITAPTRELAIQIHEEVKQIVHHLAEEDIIKPRLVIGGLDRKRMMKQLQNKPQIIIGTPGRILDMVHEGVLSIYHASAFVIDEADLMVELNFLEPIDELLVRAKQDIQVLVFSATIPQQLNPFFKKYLGQPKHIKIEDSITPDAMSHHMIALKHKSLSEKIAQISEVIQPYVALIFVNSKETADQLRDDLQAKGIHAGLLHGGLTSRERTRTVKAINELKYEYIVATDLASRGIDIKGTSHVINAELPKEIDFYIHRSGRTARAGLSGSVFSLYTEEDTSFIQLLEKKGFPLQFNDVQKAELVEAKRLDKRAARKPAETSLDREAWQYVKKPKKVKPGYKKRMKQKQERVKSQLKKKKK